MNAMPDRLDPVALIASFFDRIAPIASDLPDPLREGIQGLPTGLQGRLGLVLQEDREIARAEVWREGEIHQTYIDRGLTYSSAHQSDLGEAYRRYEADRSRAWEQAFGQMSPEEKGAIDKLCLDAFRSVFTSAFPADVPLVLHGPLARLGLDRAALARRYVARRHRWENGLSNRGLATPSTKRDRVLRQIQRAKERICAGGVVRERLSKVWGRAIRQLRRARHARPTWRRDPNLLKRWNSDLRIRQRRPGWNKLEQMPFTGYELEAAGQMPYRWLRELAGEQRAALDGQERAEPQRPVKLKRSSAKGDARRKIIAALTKHHQYADGSCLNIEPIGVNELSRRLTRGKSSGVAVASVSRFFRDEFGGHSRYANWYCGDDPRLIAALKKLNDDYTVDLLFGPKLTPSSNDED
jgi:hypothetical protein